MLVDNLYVFGSRRTFGPLETNPPLIINADALLRLAFSRKRFKNGYPAMRQDGNLASQGAR